MKYSEFTKIEQSFNERIYSDDYSDKKILSYDPYFRIYKRSKYMWKYIKIIESDDSLIIDGINKSIKDIENDLSSRYDRFKYKNILLILKNKTYKNIESLSKYDNIYILYDKEYILSFCSLEEFIKMRKTIDNYKNLINSKNLSPLEQITFVYDITKSFKYDDSEEDKCVPRAIHSAVNFKKFVCAGYIQFMNQLLYELGHNCYYVTISDDNNVDHIVSNIRVSDDKYNIYGYFIFDPSADSSKKLCLCKDKNGKKSIRYRLEVNEDYEVIREFDDLSLYKEFMIPVEQYRKCSNDNTSIFKIRDHNGKVVTKRFISKLNSFKDYTGKDLNTFFKLMYNVKQSEGYSKEEALKLICDLILINDVYPYDIDSINGVLSDIDKEYCIVRKLVFK